ncbi:MET25 protein, partial [Vidua chalybeata]|nr:MET25 protein [Vidua chalybeata]
RPSRALPAQLPPAAAARALRSAARFVRRALPLCRAHTVEFFTCGLWQRLVAPSPDAVLEALRVAGPLARPRAAGSGAAAAPAVKHCLQKSFPFLLCADDDIFSSVFCENSEKLIDVHLFALAAKYYSLSNLGVCTPLEDVLEALKGDSEGATGIKPDEFMNNKKSHEVKVMSELVDGIANYCGIKQVIDIGSGKGYLSSFLSMQYNLEVYGIDSSSSNTNGAHERNRKLKKHWRAYQSRGKESFKSQSLEMANDRPVENEINCKTINEELLNNANSLQNEGQVIIQDLVSSCGFTEMATLETNTETESDLVTGTQSHETKLSEDVLSILNVLPVDAVEDFLSSHCNCGELCEEEKVQRKMTSLKTKARKSSESNLYFPLTSCITAETELNDIITDLE